MQQRFPSFVAFRTDNGSVGFFGPVRGPRTGREYTITVKVPARNYPDMEPAVYIYPRIMSGYWQMDGVNGDPNGRLSIWHEKPWAPARNTFANCVLCAIRFLEAFDR
jgi:ubiquitin-protein ligase